jgi:hypothetical protein
MQSDLEFVVNASKRLEALLEQRLGATGRGLHEKASSVEQRLDENVVRDLRFVATVRNKLVHESGIHELDDRQRFEEVVQNCVAALSQFTPREPGLVPNTSIQHVPVLNDSAAGRGTLAAKLAAIVHGLAWWTHPDHRDGTSDLAKLSGGCALIAALMVLLGSASSGTPFFYGLIEAVVVFFVVFMLGPLVLMGLALAILYALYCLFGGG